MKIKLNIGDEAVNPNPAEYPTIARSEATKQSHLFTLVIPASLCYCEERSDEAISTAQLLPFCHL